MGAIERFFDLKGRGTTVGREVRGAVATFLTMAYILFANPSLLAAAGMPQGSAMACTAAAAGVCCLLMGLGANFPIAMASGMGLNALVAFQIAKVAGSWQAAMGLVVWDGIFILLLVLTGLREWVLDAIPLDLRRATGAGIGLFIAFIGLVNGKLVVPGPPGVPVTSGSLRDPAAIVAIVGLLFTAALVARRVTGALLIGIAGSTLLALVLGVAKLPASGFAGPDFQVALKADVLGALQPRLLPLLFSLLMVDFFDTLGTATAVAEQAGLTDARGRIPNVRRLLIVDSLSAAIGGLFGASSVTAYIESASGVAEGARTGLHTVVVGLLFLAAVFLAPLAGVVPGAATAPALILVGFLMVAVIAHIDFRNLETGIPAFLTLLMIPVSYSIAHGIGYGFLLYTVIQVLAGKARAVHPAMYVTSAAFAVFFATGG